ncbi:hypothetical protein J4406_03060 [Candidatus Woesearchaeota archaeon]|nr:hypothetical protein [Candidatus Woesearchaeota archaeon]
MVNLKKLEKRIGDGLPPTEESSDNLNNYTCLGCSLPPERRTECDNKTECEYPTDQTPHYD